MADDFRPALTEMSGEQGADASSELAVKDIYFALSKGFESLRDLQYKLPGIFSALIGGLWYFAVQELETDRIISIGIFLYAAAAGVVCMMVMWRFRAAFNAHLDKLEALEGAHAVKVPSGRNYKNPWITGLSQVSTNRWMVLLLGLTVLFSLCGIGYAALKAQAPKAPSPSAIQAGQTAIPPSAH